MPASPLSASSPPFRTAATIVPIVAAVADTVIVAVFVDITIAIVTAAILAAATAIVTTTIATAAAALATAAIVTVSVTDAIAIVTAVIVAAAIVVAKSEAPTWHQLAMRPECVILYFYPATCGPKGHGSGSAAAHRAAGSSCLHITFSVAPDRPCRS